MPILFFKKFKRIFASREEIVNKNHEKIKKKVKKNKKEVKTKVVFYRF